MRAFGTDDELEPGLWRAEPAADGVVPDATTPAAAGAPALARTMRDELIPTLARKHRGQQAQVTDSEVERFTADLLRDDEAALLARVEHLCRQGLSARHLCQDLLTPTAQRLGVLWEDDRCDFVQVTLGLGHLQRLLRGLGPRLGASECAHEGMNPGANPGEHSVANRTADKATTIATPAAQPGLGLRLLMAQLPGEQHSFGASMAVHYFQAAGWAVASTDDAAARAREQHIDVVAFSVGSEVLLEPLRRQIAATRRASRNAALVVVVGGPVFALHPGLALEVGASACPVSAQDAALHAARMARAATASAA